MKPTDKSLLPYYKTINLTGKEKVRYYRFPNNEIVQIDEPVSLIVSDNGHRLVDKEGRSHYVPYGWVHLYWDNIGNRAFYCQEDEEERKRMLEEKERQTDIQMGYKT